MLLVLASKTLAGMPMLFKTIGTHRLWKACQCSSRLFVLAESGRLANTGSMTPVLMRETSDIEYWLSDAPSHERNERH